MDRKEFQHIYEENFGFFYKIARQFIGEEDAKEVVQDAFVVLWEKRDQLTPGSNIRNFLFIVVKNKALNVLREQKKNHQNLDSKDFLLTQINYLILNETGEEILLYNELFGKIQQAIENLPDQCREVFRLSRFGNLQNKEIAEQLGITVKAVEANITRALKSLRDELHPYLNTSKKTKESLRLRTVLLSLL